MLDPDKTPPQGPFAMHLERIEKKIDAVAMLQREHTQHYRVALNTSMAAERTAHRALWTRTSWGPYVVSGLAFAMGFAALAAACGVR